MQREWGDGVWELSRGEEAVPQVKSPRPAQDVSQHTQPLLHGGEALELGKRPQTAEEPWDGEPS